MLLSCSLPLTRVVLLVSLVLVLVLVLPPLFLLSSLPRPPVLNFYETCLRTRQMTLQFQFQLLFRPPFGDSSAICRRAKCPRSSFSSWVPRSESRVACMKAPLLPSPLPTGTSTSTLPSSSLLLPPLVLLSSPLLLLLLSSLPRPLVRSIVWGNSSAHVPAKGLLSGTTRWPRVR